MQETPKIYPYEASAKSMSFANSLNYSSNLLAQNANKGDCFLISKLGKEKLESSTKNLPSFSQLENPLLIKKIKAVELSFFNQPLRLDSSFLVSTSKNGQLSTLSHSIMVKNEKEENLILFSSQKLYDQHVKEQPQLFVKGVLITDYKVAVISEEDREQFTQILVDLLERYEKELNSSNESQTKKSEKKTEFKKSPLVSTNATSDDFYSTDKSKKSDEINLRSRFNLINFLPHLLVRRIVESQRLLEVKKEKTQREARKLNKQIKKAEIKKENIKQEAEDKEIQQASFLQQTVKTKNLR